MTVGPLNLWVQTQWSNLWPFQAWACLAPQLDCIAWVSKCLAQCSKFSPRTGLTFLLWPQSTSAGLPPQVLGAGANADTQHTGEGRWSHRGRASVLRRRLSVRDPLVQPGPRERWPLRIQTPHSRTTWGHVRSGHPSTVVYSRPACPAPRQPRALAPHPNPFQGKHLFIPESQS